MKRATLLRVFGVENAHAHGKNPSDQEGRLMPDGSNPGSVSVESGRGVSERGEAGRAVAGAPHVEPPPFEQLYQLYFGFTWRVLGHLGVAAHGIDDAVQEVWLTVHRRLPSFEGRSALKTWLFGIALNVARNQRRADTRRSKHMPEAPSGHSPLDPELIREGHEAWERVQRFLATLDEQRRAIFVCNLLENLSAMETADATGVDVTTVYKRVRALRQSFRMWLADEIECEGRVRS
jgi:RNA polymerase sigma-70 factor (ECF subfamily)